MATAADTYRIAKGEIGYRESGTNHQKYSPAVPGLEWSQNQPWCATFQSWVALKAGMKAGTDFPSTASCLAAVAWFKGHGRWHTTPAEGDWVLYGPGGGTHVELVVKVTSTTITTIGGNTSGALNGRYYNGDGVYQKVIYRNNSRIYGYGRPKYAVASKPVAAKVPYPGRVLKLKSPMMHGGDVKDVQNRIARLGIAKLDIDGYYGPKSRAAVVAFQKKNKLSADGEVGPKTWAKLFP